MSSFKQVIKKAIRYFWSPLILGDYFKFKKSLKSDHRFRLHYRDVYPCFKDKTIKTGFDRHYVYHTSWAARKLAETKPELHLDISSSLYFSGIVSAFVPIKFYDYRPADIQLDGLESLGSDLLSLPFADNSVSSLSCMHVIEHIGLGRYGDPIDPQADAKAIVELKRVLAVGGNLLFVVPIGREAVIQYNAHRIYTYQLVLELFAGLKLKEFSLIPEVSGALIKNATASDVARENYACGCFWFTK